MEQKKGWAEHTCVIAFCPREATSSSLPQSLCCIAIFRCYGRRTLTIGNISAWGSCCGCICVSLSLFGFNTDDCDECCVFMRCIVLRIATINLFLRRITELPNNNTGRTASHVLIDSRGWFYFPTDICIWSAIRKQDSGVVLRSIPLNPFVFVSCVLWTRFKNNNAKIGIFPWSPTPVASQHTTGTSQKEHLANILIVFTSSELRERCTWMLPAFVCLFPVLPTQRRQLTKYWFWYYLSVEGQCASDCMDGRLRSWG